MKEVQAILLVNLLFSIREGFSTYFDSEICPSVYKLNYNGQFFSGIIITPPLIGGRNNLRVQFAVDDPEEISDFILATEKSLNETLQDAHNGKNAAFKFNSEEGNKLPWVHLIQFNTKYICNNTEEEGKYTFWHTFEIDLPCATTSRTFECVGNDATWLKSLPTVDTCGKRANQQHLIIGGEQFPEGDYPWLVVLFHFNGRLVEPKCGGSLISDSYIITAAQCTTNQRRVYLELGRHNISDPFEEAYITRISKKIIVHPEYNSKAHGDVALIQVERIEFTPRIIPICLWAHGTTLDNIIKKGIVTGWGQIGDDGPSSTTPRKLDVEILELDMCRKSNKLLQDITTNYVFCAGGKSDALCRGFGGGGFYIQHNNVWYLRGIISTTLGNEFACYLNSSSVYVDLIYYLDWMQPYLLPDFNN